MFDEVCSQLLLKSLKKPLNKESYKFVLKPGEKEENNSCCWKIKNVIEYISRSLTVFR